MHKKSSLDTLTPLQPSLPAMWQQEIKAGLIALLLPLSLKSQHQSEFTDKNLLRKILVLVLLMFWFIFNY